MPWLQRSTQHAAGSRINEMKRASLLVATETSAEIISKLHSIMELGVKA
jgi:hypothetical protein